jgi:hypothetical protein
MFLPYYPTLYTTTRLELHNWLFRTVNYSWTLAIIQILFSIVVFYLMEAPQTSGVAVAVMGLVAVIMTVRAEEDWGRTERILWLSFALVLLIGEIRAIKSDRENQQRLEQEMRNSENRNFEDVLRKDQVHFDDTLREMNGITRSSNKALALSNKALKQITGGGQYCYLMIGLPVGNNAWQMSVLNSGEMPLDICRVVVYDESNTSPPKDFAEAMRQMRPIASEQVGPLAPGVIPHRQGMLGSWTNIVLPVGSYYIQITTRNDRFYETLTLSPPQPGKAIEEIKITDELGKTVYQEPQLPKTSKQPHPK